MPSSRPNTIPTVIHVVRQLKPASILDVGVGFGKWGHLFREYTDILEAEHDPKRYQRRNWRVRIDGIEAHKAYLTPMHRFLYNQLYVGAAQNIIPRLPCYDLIFLGDIIEHFTKPEGKRLLTQCLAKAAKAVLISTPKFETHQGGLCGNELERHRSLWTELDFQEFPRAAVKTIDRDTLLAALAKPGVPAPKLAPPRQARDAVVRRLETTRTALVRSTARDEKFILVDEEQLRSTLPHNRALPFLEKDGQYWGPPPEDATAIAELSRMRKGGATAIAFVWPTFWWLDHYKGLRDYLRKTCKCRVKTRDLIVFDLAGR